jgi:hypothetical protein
MSNDCRAFGALYGVAWKSECTTRERAVGTAPARQAPANAG